MKKFVSLFLALIMIFSVSVVSFAEETGNTETETVAEIYLCVCNGLNSTYPAGHAWICIKNVSSDVLTAGTQTINPGEMISAGLQPFRGMRFNEEMSAFAGTSVKAMERDITEEEFNSAVSEILKSEWNTYELFTHNCTNFATSVWKAATGETIVPFCFPFIVSLQMKDTVRLMIK